MILKTKPMQSLWKQFQGGPKSPTDIQRLGEHLDDLKVVKENQLSDIDAMLRELHELRRQHDNINKADKE